MKDNDYKAIVKQTMNITYKEFMEQFILFMNIVIII